MQTQSGLLQKRPCGPTVPPRRWNLTATCLWAGLRLTLIHVFAAWGVNFLPGFSPVPIYNISPRPAFAATLSADPAAQKAAGWLRAQRTKSGAITEQDGTANAGQTALAALAIQLAEGDVPSTTEAQIQQLVTTDNTPHSQLARAAFYLHATQAPSSTVLAQLQAACTETACGATQTERAQLLLALALWESPAPAHWLSTLAQSQFSSGGWPTAFQGQNASVRATAWTLLALVHLQAQPETQAHAAKFLLACQTQAGTWANTCYTWDGPETGATALAWLALRAYGQAPTAALKSVEKTLRAAQMSNGAFPYYTDFPGASVEATTLAILALQGWGTPTIVQPEPVPAPTPDFGLWALGAALVVLILLILWFAGRYWRNRSQKWSH